MGPKKKTKKEKVTESSGVKSENKKGLKKGWWALWEVAKEEGLPWDPNNEGLMKLLYSLVEGCTERPGPLPQKNQNKKKAASVGLLNTIYICKNLTGPILSLVQLHKDTKSTAGAKR